MSRSIIRLLVLLSVCSVYACTVSGQQAGIEMLGPKEGLSQGFVSAIFQDREGFIWIGTKNGLNRYDGYQFEVFTNDPYDEHTLLNDYINTIYERGDFLILGGIKGGLNLMYKKTRKVFRIPFKLLVASTENTDGAIFWTQFDAYGNLWIQLHRPDQGNYLTQITFPEGFWERPPENSDWLQRLKVKTWPHQVFGHSCLSADGKLLYIPDANTINQLDIRSGRSFPIISNLRTQFGSWLYLDSRGNLLINCIIDETHSFFRLTLGKTPALKRMAVPDGFLAFTKITPDSLVWLQTKKGCSAYRLDVAGNFDLTQPEIVAIAVPSGLSSLMQDRSGIVWLGTNGLGLIKFNPRAGFFRHLLPGQSISAPILQDSQGNICTANSENYPLFSIKKSQGAVARLQKAALDFWPNGRICTDRQGSSWVAGVPKGKKAIYLAKVPEHGEIRYFLLPPFEFPLRELALALNMDKKGNIWIGCAGNLICFDPALERANVYSFAHLITKGHSVNALLCTSDNSWWIGTNEGLVQATPSEQGFRFRVFQTDATNQNSLRNNNVASLITDRGSAGQVLWIGTKGGGLNRLDLQTMKFTHLTTANGLPNNVIYAILTDEGGNLWMSSNKGLIYYSPSTGEIRNYTEADGAQANEFNTWAYGKGPGGELFFGGVNGITAFHPGDLKANTVVPQVCIKGLRLNNELAQWGHDGDVLQKAVEFTRSVEIPYSKNNITLEFVALDYSVPEKNRFRYYLEGAESSWRHGSNEHRATYLNLAPGSYTFKVVGSNNDGAWNITPASLKITVLPPWYLTWWAWLLYVLAVLAVIYRIYRYQLHRRLEHAETLRLKELDAFKSTFFTNISHDLRTPLTLILSPLKRLIKNGQFSAEETRQLQLMTRSGEQLKERIDEILALSQLEAGKLELKETTFELYAFLLRIMGNFESHAQQIGINLVLDYQALKPCYCLFDLNKLEKILNNLLGNALKFTPEGGSVMLATTIDDVSDSAGFVTFRISDTGRGIAIEDQPFVFDRYFQSSLKKAAAEGGTGIGLAIVREFATRMGGKVGLQSIPGQGATFTVQLPLRLAEPGMVVQNEEEGHKVLPAADAPLRSMRPGVKNNIRILVAEDNPGLREYLEMILKPHYEVISVANGQIAWEYCRQPDFNCQLILSDIMMPEMDGVALLEKVRAYPATRLLPFIFLTARAGIEDRLQAMRIGVDDYLLKPFEEEELLVRVANLLQNYRERTSIATVAETPAVLAATEDQAPGAADIWVERLRTYTLENLTNPTFSIQQLTEVAGMGHSTFNEKMKLETGLTPNLFVREIRLLQARTLLETVACSSVQEVCRKVGFQKTAYFSQLFKERFGKNPSAYLEN